MTDTEAPPEYPTEAELATEAMPTEGAVREAALTVDRRFAEAIHAEVGAGSLLSAARTLTAYLRGLDRFAVDDTPRPRAAAYWHRRYVTTAEALHRATERVTELGRELRAMTAARDESAAEAKVVTAERDNIRNQLYAAQRNVESAQDHITKLENQLSYYQSPQPVLSPEASALLQQLSGSTVHGDPEIGVMAAIIAALEPLEDVAQGRVISYVRVRLGL